MFKFQLVKMSAQCEVSSKETDQYKSQIAAKDKALEVRRMYDLSC